MREIVGQLPRLIVISIICVILIGVYYFVFTLMDIVPLIGKEAPSIVIIWFAQLYLASNWVNRNPGVEVHFLKLFLYQYIFVLLTAIILSISIYYFFTSNFGLEVLQGYIRSLINEQIDKKDLIIKSNGKTIYFQLIEGINNISAISIIRNEFWEKIFLAFPVNLLTSLYYKR